MSAIEKLSTEYGSSEFMLTAKLLAGELKRDPEADEIIDPERHEYDPNITDAFMKWAGKQHLTAYVRLALESPIFTSTKYRDRFTLMFTLNVMATNLDGYYNRNESERRQLETRADSFQDRQPIVDKIEAASAYFNRFRFRVDSFWYKKSNAFTLLITLCESHEYLARLNHSALKSALNHFGDNPPADYALAAKEAVNNKRERTLRSKYVREIVREAGGITPTP